MLKRLGCVTVVAIASLLAQPARADLFVPSNTSESTFSSAEIDTTVDNRVNQTVQQYSTELDFGFLGGPALSSQTYFVAASDPAFQAAISAAVATLLGDGAASTNAPTLVSSNTSTTIVTQTVQTGRTTTQSVSTGEFVGPATFTSGDRGVCQSATLVNTTPGLSGGTSPSNQYPLLSGCSGGSPSQVTLGSAGVDVDTLVLTRATIQTATTVTDTVQLYQVYRLDGVIPAPVSVPEAPSFAILAISLLLLGGIGWTRIPRDPQA